MDSSGFQDAEVLSLNIHQPESAGQELEQIVH